MPKHSVTAGASKLIRELRGQGKTLREIASSLQKRFGKAFEPSTIKRHLDTIEGKKRDQPAEKRARAAKRSPKRKPRASKSIRELIGVEPDGTEKGPEPKADPLEEIEALEREIARAQAVLETDMPHRDRTALNASLVQLYAARRKAQHAQREDAALQDADAAWVLAKAKRFDKMNRGEDPDEDDEDGAGELPQASGTEGGV